MATLVVNNYRLFRKETEVVLPPSIDEVIFGWDEPWRTWGIKKFLDADDEYADDRVLIRANDGKAYKFFEDGKWVSIPPKGKRFAPRTALRLLLQYGERGQYTKYDKFTGMTKARWEVLGDEQRSKFKREPYFPDNFLTHVPDIDEDEEPSTEQE